MHHFKAMGEFKLELQSGSAQFGSRSAIFVRATLKFDIENNRAPLLCCFKFCASFHCHQWIQTEVTVRKRPFEVKIDVFVPCELKMWQMTLKNNRAPLLCYFKLFASFHSHLWIQTGVTVQKLPNWVRIDIFLAVWPWHLTDDLEKQ